MGERFIVTFEAKMTDCPPAVRLRSLLKIAARVFSLKCIAAKELPAQVPSPVPEQEQPAEPPAAPPAASEATREG